MPDVTAFVIRIYKLNVKAISYYLNRLEKKFTICKCRICWEDYGKKDICYFPMTHVKNSRTPKGKKCCMQTQGIVYCPDEYKEFKK